MRVTCGSCGDVFEARRKNAKYCSDRCRQHGRRHPTDHDATDPEEQPESSLVAELRRDLEEAGRLDTFAGQLAIELARKVSAVEATGVSGLSKELRVVRAEALAGAEPVESAAEPEEDEVEKARRRREEARKKAGLA